MEEDNREKKGKGQVKEYVYKGSMDKDNVGARRIECRRKGWAGRRRAMGKNGDTAIDNLKN